MHPCPYLLVDFLYPYLHDRNYPLRYDFFDSFTSLLLTGAMNTCSVLSSSKGSNSITNGTIDQCNSMFTFSKLLSIVLLALDILVINFSGKGVCFILLENILNLNNLS
jgi:hypothetical protein